MILHTFSKKLPPIKNIFYHFYAKIKTFKDGPYPGCRTYDSYSKRTPQFWINIFTILKYFIW